MIFRMVFSCGQRSNFALQTVGLILIAICDGLQANDLIFDRPTAVAVSLDGAVAVVGNYQGSFITVVDTHTQATRRIEGEWCELVDLAMVPATRRLLAVAKSTPQIVELSLDSANAMGAKSIVLPGIPAKLAISMDGRFACVTMTWKHAVYVTELVDTQSQNMMEGKVISLDFQPKEIVSLANGLFLVADAFGGQLAVIEAVSAKLVASHMILGHHIGGLARDDSLQTIAITHQKLSGIAQTSRDDIHWGTLMQNLVSVVPESLLIDPASNIIRNAERFLLGDVGNGAADPSGVIAWNGSLAIAISGTSKIAFRDNPRARFQFLNVEHPPTRLAKLSGSKLIWISPVGGIASILEYHDDQVHNSVAIGTSRVMRSAEDRGEAAFFSGHLSHDGWMSCGSCHVDGHSPDLLADTKGDGRFGNPKRIPSLLNSAHTGPWTWNGSEASLEGQIEKTLTSTMHRNATSRERIGSDESVANDIAVFLRKQILPTETPSVPTNVDLGRALFQVRGCVRCHQPDNYYTSPENYDVGAADEAGDSLFNPPSLRGLSHRRAYFHDARFKAIGHLLDNHPDTKSIWTTNEKIALELFLKSL